MSESEIGGFVSGSLSEARRVAPTQPRSAVFDLVGVDPIVLWPLLFSLNVVPLFLSLTSNRDWRMTSLKLDFIVSKNTFFLNENNYIPNIKMGALTV